MFVTVVLDHRFYATAGGAVWTKSAFGEKFWQRYLSVFNRVRIVARAQQVAAPQEGWQRVDSPEVGFWPVPYYLGPWQFLGKVISVHRAVRAALSGECAVILRTGELANCAAGLLLRGIRPFGVEVGGDPHESLAPGCVRSWARPLARLRATHMQKRVCAAASCVSYVTADYLQRRYPSMGMQFAISDVELQERTHLGDDVQLGGDAFPDPFAAPKRSRRVRRLLFVGSLAQMYKGVDDLLKAYALCMRRGLDLSLEIVGDGQYRSELERLAHRLGVGDGVHFLGEVPAGLPIRKCLDDADMFVLPSRTEGLPRAMIEAMACALPCIGTNVGGIPELLTSEDLVPPNNPEALASRICEIANDPDRLAAMSARNARKAMEYSDEIQGRRRLAFYGFLRETTEHWVESQELGRRRVSAPIR